jgi:hypothetical protein
MGRRRKFSTPSNTGSADAANDTDAPSRSQRNTLIQWANNILTLNDSGEKVTLRDVEKANAILGLDKVQEKESPPPKSANFAKNQLELAAALGRDRKTIQRWRARQDWPKKKIEKARGAYDIEATRAWAVAQGLMEAPEEDEGLTTQDTELLALRKERESIRVERERFALEKEKKLWLWKEDVLRDQTEAVQKERQMWLQLPAQLAPRLAGRSIPEIATILEMEFIDRMNRLHRGDVYAGLTPGDGHGQDASDRT